MKLFSLSCKSINKRFNTASVQTTIQKYKDWYQVCEEIVSCKTLEDYPDEINRYISRLQEKATPECIKFMIPRVDRSRIIKRIDKKDLGKSIIEECDIFTLICLALSTRSRIPCNVFSDKDIQDYMIYCLHNFDCARRDRFMSLWKSRMEGKPVYCWSKKTLYFFQVWEMYKPNIPLGKNTGINYKRFRRGHMFAMSTLKQKIYGDRRVKSKDNVISYILSSKDLADKHLLSGEEPEVIPKKHMGKLFEQLMNDISELRQDEEEYGSEYEYSD